MSVELRAPRRDDAPRIANALDELSRVAGLDPETAEEVATSFDAPGLDTEQNARVALVGGEIVGYVDVSDGASEGRFVWVDPRATPRGKKRVGLGGRRPESNRRDPPVRTCRNDADPEIRLVRKARGAVGLVHPG